MNGYFFNKANAEARAQRIREEAEEEQIAAQFTKNEQKPATPEEQREMRKAKIRTTFRPQEA